MIRPRAAIETHYGKTHAKRPDQSANGPQGSVLF